MKYKIAGCFQCPRFSWKVGGVPECSSEIGKFELEDGAYYTSVYFDVIKLRAWFHHSGNECPFYGKNNFAGTKMHPSVPGPLEKAGEARVVKVTRPITVYQTMAYEPVEQTVVGCWYCENLRQSGNAPSEQDGSEKADKRCFCCGRNNNILMTNAESRAVMGDALRDALNNLPKDCPLSEEEKSEALKIPQPISAKIKVDGCYNCDFLEMRKIYDTDSSFYSVFAVCSQNGRLIFVEEECDSRSRYNREKVKERCADRTIPEHCPFYKKEMDKQSET